MSKQELCLEECKCKNKVGEKITINYQSSGPFEFDGNTQVVLGVFFEPQGGGADWLKLKDNDNLFFREEKFTDIKAKQRDFEVLGPGKYTVVLVGFEKDRIEVYRQGPLEIFS